MFGGGGRADFGILHFADQIWISDNTEATARLSIQEGFSQFLPANTMEAWVRRLGQECRAAWIPFPRERVRIAWGGRKCQV
ncbi:MAG: alpha-galactosidase [Anaerolineales bacterium]|nr:alpha-galactosidase [Anaerolineales bacterium]